MINRFVERMFPNTVMGIWRAGHKSGQTYGINRTRALIYAEIKMLEKIKVDKKTTDARILELKFILTRIEGML